MPPQTKAFIQFLLSHPTGHYPGGSGMVGGWAGIRQFYCIAAGKTMKIPPKPKK
jgi:hypothetical protein